MCLATYSMESCPFGPASFGWLFLGLFRTRKTLSTTARLIVLPRVPVFPELFSFFPQLSREKKNSPGTQFVLVFGGKCKKTVPVLFKICPFSSRLCRWRHTHAPPFQRSKQLKQEERGNLTERRLNWPTSAMSSSFHQVLPFEMGGKTTDEEGDGASTCKPPRKNDILVIILTESRASVSERRPVSPQRGKRSCGMS